MNNITTTEDKNCLVIYKIQDKILRIGWNDDGITETSKNPELQNKLQTELSQHIMKCSHSKCQKSYKARVEVGIQTKDGVYNPSTGDKWLK